MGMDFLAPQTPNLTTRDKLLIALASNSELILVTSIYQANFSGGRVNRIIAIVFPGKTKKKSLIRGSGSGIGYQTYLT